MTLKRIVKDPDVRRMEIMVSAKKLFERKGYTNTSVEAIIKDAGIAKGTFYYYFKTKQDILKALVEHLGSELEAHFDSITKLPKLTAVQKLKLMIRGQEKEALASSPILGIIHKPENREFQELLNIQTVKNIFPLLAKVFYQGHKEGVFKNEVTLEAIQLMFAGSQFILDSGLFEWTPKQRANFLKAGQSLLELIAGAKPGSLKFISAE